MWKAQNNIGICTCCASRISNSHSIIQPYSRKRTANNDAFPQVEQESEWRRKIWQKYLSLSLQKKWKGRAKGEKKATTLYSAWVTVLFCTYLHVIISPSFFLHGLHLLGKLRKRMCVLWWVKHQHECHHYIMSVIACMIWGWDFNKGWFLWLTK